MNVPQTPPVPGRRLVRRAAWAVLALTLLLAAGLGAAFLFLGHVNLASFAAQRASAALGRDVAVGHLHVIPGRWLRIDLADVNVPNIPGGNRPAMLTVGRMTAEVDAMSLLRGPVVVRRLTVDGLSLYLQKAGADRVKNWRFGPEPEKKAAVPAGRGWFPTLLDARLRASDVIVRTSGGKELRTALDEASLETGSDTQPVRLAATGSYNGIPVALTGDLQPIAAFRSAAPFGTDLRLTSGDTTLDFKGTMTDPLDVDGAVGTLALRAPTAGPVLAIAGATADVDLSLDLVGQLSRSGDRWDLSDATGALKGNPITSATLRLVEGGPGKPDSVGIQLAFDRLDVNGLMSGGGSPGKPSSTGADIPLDVSRAPDTLIDAELSARRLTYGALDFDSTRIAAALDAGQVAVRELTLDFLGGRVQAAGKIEAGDKGGQVSADVTVTGADVQKLRQSLGFNALPLSGKLDALVVAASSGATLNAAVRTARVSAAVSMNGGAVSREVVAKAAQDITLLFRNPKGQSAVSCLLAVVDMRGGVGTVLPLRLRSADGTITGNASFDLYRRTFDLTFGTESATTGALALDIPIRVSGGFANPTVRPAQLSGAGRAALAAGNGRVARLPPAVQQFARRSRCLSGG